jgi:ubiquinone/menaquinone biosynthesis C-methylase UbiE
MTMNVESQKKQHYSSIETSGIAYWTIRLIHDNPLLPLVRNPYKLLRAARLDRKQKVVEVGCGPGFFTIPAANMVGEKGHVYAIDINRRAIERVRRKTEKEKLENVTPLCINASKTGLSAGSCDLAFVFGLRHIAGGLEKVLLELHRILRPGGTLSLEKTKGPETALIGAAEKAGFIFSEKHGRIFRFKKRGLS